MGDFADDYLQRHPNILGLPELQLDPSLAPPPSFMPSVPSVQLDPSLLPPPPNLQPDPTQLNPAIFGGGSPASSFNAFGHLAPELTLGYGPPLIGPPVTGTPVNDPSSFTYNLGSGSAVPTLGADQTGTVTAGVSSGAGPSMAATLNPQGVGQVQVGETVEGVGPFDLNLQSNVGTDGTVGGSAALQRGNSLRFGANGTYNPSSQSGSVGFGVSGTF
ncbi:MAG TPA: hypothetical protein VHT91_00800 [Kofleriaceae bacterium]|jgi:hypothetical protein|nr:hypothetical protein [Kofleriaceae bacterium]